MGRHAEGWKPLWRGGICYVRFTHKKHRYTLTTGERDPEKAPAECARIYSDVVSGKRVTPIGARRGVQPLRTLFAEWLADYGADHDEKTTETYELYAFTHWDPFFRDADEITRPACLGDYSRKRIGEVLRKTVQKERGALRKFHRWMVEQEIILVVPAMPELNERAVGVRVGPQRAQANELSPAQVRDLLRTLPWESARASSVTGKRFMVRPRFIVGYEHGFRPATLDELIWADVQGTRIWIRDEADKARAGRPIEMGPVTREVFEAIPRGAPKDLVFGSHDYRYHLAQAGQRIGVPKLAPYDVRHARATHLVDEGAPLTAVGYILGHVGKAGPATTAKYVRPNQRAATEAMGRSSVLGTISDQISEPDGAKEGSRTPTRVTPLEPESSGNPYFAEDPESQAPQEAAESGSVPEPFGSQIQNSDSGPWPPPPPMVDDRTAAALVLERARRGGLPQSPGGQLLAITELAGWGPPDPETGERFPALLTAREAIALLDAMGGVLAAGGAS